MRLARRLFAWFERHVSRLALIAAVGMFLVLVLGATVTSTGSGEGCGADWPMCHGKPYPPLDREAIIEWTHRFVTSVEGFFLFGASIGAWRLRRRIPLMRLLAPLTVFTLLLQSGMGAWAVKYSQSSTVLALHFGISLTAFATTVLMWRALREDGAAETRPAPPAGFRVAAWSAIALVYVVAYSGAYMRHSDAQLACTTWPLCNGEVAPGFSGAVGVAFGHRVAAIGAVVAIGFLAWWASKLRDARPDLYALNLAALVLVLAQAASGAVLIWTRISLFSALLHAALMALLFVCLAESCRRVLTGSREPRAHGSLAAASPAD